MVSLHTGRLVVMYLYLTFSVDPLRVKFIPKITIFRDFGGCKPTF